MIDVAEPVWAITAGEGGVWAIALRGSMCTGWTPVEQGLRDDPLSGAVPYAWAGGGALWAADDDGQALIRIDTGTNAQVARLPVGNGLAGFAFDGTFAWLLNHRENSLDRINPVDNAVTRMATILGGEQVAAERINGLRRRPLDHRPRPRPARVSRANGSVLGQTEIGAGGIDVVADGTNLGQSLRGDGRQRGEPIPDAAFGSTGPAPSQARHADASVHATGAAATVSSASTLSPAARGSPSSFRAWPWRCAAPASAACELRGRGVHLHVRVHVVRRLRGRARYVCPNCGGELVRRPRPAAA